MKETYYDKMLRLQLRLVNRVKKFKEMTDTYIEDGDYVRSMECSVKYRTCELILNDVNAELS